MRPVTSVQLRIYEPGPAYPHGWFLSREGVYVATEDVVFTAYKRKIRRRRSLKSDYAWVEPEEIRILAAVALSVPEGRGAAGFAPHWGYRIVDLPKPLRLAGSACTSRLIDAAVSHAREVYGSEVGYELRNVESSGVAFQQDLFASIDPRDQLLIRGLYTLLKSWHLARLPNGSFLEEALMNLQISREAALEILREVLLSKGLSNPSFKDAHDYLHRNFIKGKYLARAFSDLHHLWVWTKHPNSAVGPFWSPPMMADDVFHTYGALVSVYRHILTGEPGRVSACLGLPDDLR
jgi:hypothetical protein